MGRCESAAVQAAGCTRKAQEKGNSGASGDSWRSGQAARPGHRQAGGWLKTLNLKSRGKADTPMYICTEASCTSLHGRRAVHHTGARMATPAAPASHLVALNCSPHLQSRKAECAKWELLGSRDEPQMMRGSRTHLTAANILFRPDWLP